MVLAGAHEGPHEVKQYHRTLDFAFAGAVRPRRVPEAVVEYDCGPGRALGRYGTFLYAVKNTFS